MVELAIIKTTTTTAIYMCQRPYGRSFTSSLVSKLVREAGRKQLETFILKVTHFADEAWQCKLRCENF